MSAYLDKWGMSALENYLDEWGRGKRLAATCGLSGAEISRVRNGRKASIRTALLIEVATGGKVPAETTCDDQAALAALRALRLKA